MFLEVSQTSQKSTCVGVYIWKACSLKACNFTKKDSSTIALLWSLWNFKEHLFLQNTSSDCFGTVGRCFCIFFKKVLLNSYFAILLWSTIFFSSQNIVWCMQSRTCLFIICRHLSGFLNAWSHEQHFSKYHFLGICQYVFAWISIMKKQNTNQKVGGTCENIWSISSQVWILKIAKEIWNWNSDRNLIMALLIMPICCLKSFIHF